MSNPHNHPPRCCCTQYPPQDEGDVCPACTQHGDLAPRVELIDTGTMFAAVPVACSRPGSNRGDGRGCTDPYCLRHGEPDEDGPGPDPYAGRQVYTRNDGSVI